MVPRIAVAAVGAPQFHLLQRLVVRVIPDRVGDGKLTRLAFKNCSRLLLLAIAFHTLQRHLLGTVRALERAAFQTAILRSFPRSWEVNSFASSMERI
jgi:hypothetical protein